MVRLSSADSIKRAEKIRKLHSTGKYSLKALARKFGISTPYVKNIILGKKCRVHVKPKGNWKDITLCGVRYAVSDDGRVWTYALNRLRTFRKSGYAVIHVDDASGVRRNFKVHRLVLTLFGRPPKKGEVCRHLDDDKTNNHISNLAWGTEQDNADDGKRNGVFAKGENVFTSKLTAKTVKKFAKGYTAGSMRAYCGQFKDDHDLDISIKQLLLILQGKYWSDVTGIKDYEKKYVQKLDEKAVRFVHKRWKKYKSTGMQQQDFCIRMSEFLSGKGYDVAWRTIKKALNGYSFKHIHTEFN